MQAVPSLAQDLHWMRQALLIGAQGLGRCAPNPSVGCVLVQEGRELARARTGDGGRPHAEETALALAIERAGVIPLGTSAYVTLEPCGSRSNGGASCAQLLVQAQIARVVIAARDPHPHADGAGLARLAHAGIALTIGLCADEAARQHAGFFSLVRSGLPLLVLEAQACTSDADFELGFGEDVRAALMRHGRAGHTRLRISPGSLVEGLVRAGGFVPYEP